MSIRTIKVSIKTNTNDTLKENDLGLFFLNIMILSLLLPVFLEVLSMDIKKNSNYRSIDSIQSQVKGGLYGSERINP